MAESEKPRSYFGFLRGRGDASSAGGPPPAASDLPAVPKDHQYVPPEGSNLPWWCRLNLPFPPVRGFRVRINITFLIYYAIQARARSPAPTLACALARLRPLGDKRSRRLAPSRT